jgi:hypothetical protein
MMNIAIAPGYPGSLSQEESTVYLASFRALLCALPNLETVQVLAGPAASASGTYFRELAAVCTEASPSCQSVRNLIVPIDAYCVCPAFIEVRRIMVIPNLFSHVSVVACEEDKQRELLLTQFCADFHGLQKCRKVEEVRFMPLQRWDTECVRVVVPCASLYIMSVM